MLGFKESIPYGMSSKDDVEKMVDIDNASEDNDMVNESRLCIEYPNINQTKKRIEMMKKTTDLISALKNEKELLIEKEKMEKGGLIKGVNFADIIEKTRANIEEKRVEIVENISFLKNLLDSSKEKIDVLTEYTDSLDQASEEEKFGLPNEEVEIIGLKADREKGRLITEVKILEDEIKILEDKIGILDSEDEIKTLEAEIAKLETE